MEKKQDEVQLRKVIEILQKFKEISGLSINLKKTNIVPFGKFLEPHIMNFMDHTRLKRADNFRLLGIDFNNKLKGMENNFKAQLDKMRKEMFAWYRVRLSNEEKALVVKTHGLSKFTHIATIMEDQ